MVNPRFTMLLSDARLIYLPLYLSWLDDASNAAQNVARLTSRKREAQEETKATVKKRTERLSEMYVEKSRGRIK